MSLRIAIAFIFTIHSFAILSQDNSCSKKDILLNYTGSIKFTEAVNLMYSENEDEALPLIKELYLETDTSKNTSLRKYTLFLEGEFYRKIGAYKKSQETFKTFIGNYKAEEPITFYAYLSLGQIAIYGFEQYNEAINYYKKAEKLNVTNSCAKSKVLLYNALGTSYLINENYTESEKYYNLELAGRLENKEQNLAAIAYSNLGNLFYEQYQDEKAKEYFLKALNTFSPKDSTNIKARQVINLNLSEVYGAANDFKKSLAYLKSSNDLKDSIWNRDKVWELSEIAKEFEVKQKQQEVDLLQVENKIKETQRNGLLLSAFILLTLLITVFYFYTSKVKSNRIIQTQKEELDQLNATKDKLFSIVSHDLRSSVNALKTSNANLIETLASKNLDKLDTLLRTNSNIANGAYNLLDNLLNWALLQTKQSYFEISEQRLFFIVEQVSYNYLGILEEKEINFTNRIGKKEKVLVDQESLKIILRNLIDNAIKFSKESGIIKVYTVEESGEYCKLIIEDTGLGMKERTRIELEKDSKLLAKKENEDILGTGLGLQLCKAMIKKNQGKLSIESTLGEGTKMIVYLKKIS